MKANHRLVFSNHNSTRQLLPTYRGAAPACALDIRSPAEFGLSHTVLSKSSLVILLQCDLSCVINSFLHSYLRNKLTVIDIH